MKQILSTKLLRYTQMIEHLYHADHVVTLTELSKLLDCSTRILREYVFDLNNNVGSGLFDISVSQEKVIIDFYDQNNMENFYSRIIKLSNEFDLLEYILFNPGRSVTELSEMMFLSPSTVYRFINRIEPILKDRFNIRLKTNPCFLSGDEWVVRHFYAQFFTEKYVHNEWPYPEVNREKVEYLVSQLIKKTAFKMEYIPYRWLTHLVAVSLIRYEQGHHGEAVDNENNFGIQLTAIQDIMEKAHHEVDETILADILSGFHIPYYASSFSELIDLSLKHPYYNRSYTRWTTMIDRLAGEFDIELEKRQDIVLTMHNISQLEYLGLFSQPVFMERRRIFYEQLVERLPKFFERLTQYVTEYQKEAELYDDEDTINYLVYAFCSSCDTCVPSLLGLLPKIKILILSNIDLFHAKLLQQYLEFFGTNQIECQVFTENYLDDESGKNYDHDLVLSNIPLLNYNLRPVLQVQDIMKIEDYVRLAELIKAIEKEKVRKNS